MYLDIETLIDILLDSLLDTAKALPFLLGAYLLIEFIEHRAGEKFVRFLSRFGNYSPLAGAALGIVPQCGFSVSASDLYSGGVISGGTLIAVFISTSDEALPILFAHPQSYGTLLPLIAIKLVSAIIFGFLFDFIFQKSRENTEQFHEQMHSHCDDECCEHGILVTSLVHTLKSALFLLGAVVAINIVVTLVPANTIGNIFANSSLLQPLLAAVIGFVPTCATSILLSELYISGILSFGSLCAGLMTNAGFGLLVLLRVNKHRKKTLGIIAYMLASAALCGTLIQLVM